ncbi:RNA-binding S4 domain-containing protein [Chitinophaga rhizosphaerae]|uniref:RNA-binding S4 domain-containing protein n=1 Tax=Chitinophaga rhizosphaerae TaxID=1864947 RepID=UPI000F806239|nr:RNA-binding S4 domain-containing protein [Chitinophaga rhizosphaerae]
MTAEKLRVDKYLWSIRVFKTRSAAAAACDAGRVKLNGVSVKAARAVNIGDEFDIRGDARKWKVKVTGLLANRQAYSEAIKYYIDLTPEEDLDPNKRVASSFDTGKRQSKIGRPTKKERRDLDDFMQED